MKGEVAGSIAVDAPRKPRGAGKSLAHKVAALDVQIERALNAIRRAESRYERLKNRRTALVEQARKQRAELDAIQ